MSINKEIIEAVKPLGLSAFFIERGNNSIPCIVFNYFSNGKTFSDNKQESEEFTVLINILTYSNVTATNEAVKKALLKAGFIGGQLQPSIKQSEYFNTAIKFKKIIFNKEDI